MIWSNKEVLKLISAEFFILGWTCYFIELYFNFAVWLNFIFNETVVSWLHEIGSFHLLLRKSCIKRKNAIVKLRPKIIWIRLNSFNIDVKRSWIFYFDKIFKFRVSIEGWCELILVIEEPFIVESVADFPLRLVTFFQA